MADQDRLIEIERGFWTGGEQHFLDHLAENCLLVFPQDGEMVGIFPRQQVAATAINPNRWKDLDISDVVLLALGDDVAMLSYRAAVKRADGVPYHALVSSGYVRRDQEWKLAFHQHSPVEQPAGSGD